MATEGRSWRPRASGRQECLTVGEAAARIGLSASTLRSWDRRYSLTPSGRSPGGHRRYSREDVDLLRRVHQLVITGETPARAAMLARRQAGPVWVQPGSDGEHSRQRSDELDEPPFVLDAAGVDDSESIMKRTGKQTARSNLGRRRGGPGGRVLSVPSADPRARGLARAAIALDVDEMVALVGQALLIDGATATWDNLIRPVLAAAGAFWARTGQGIEVEHLLSRAIAAAFAAYQLGLPRPDADRPPVVLACVSYDEHTLSLEALATVLREAGCPVRMLGGRVPPDALAATLRRTGSRTALVWAQLTKPGFDAVRELPPARPALRVIAGGPGWEGAPLPVGLAVVNDLDSAMNALLQRARA